MTPVQLVENNPRDEYPLLSADYVTVGRGEVSGSVSVNVVEPCPNIAEGYLSFLRRRQAVQIGSARLSGDHIVWAQVDSPDPSIYFWGREQEHVEEMAEGVVVFERKRKILASKVVHFVVRDLPRRRPRVVITEESLT